MASFCFVRVHGGVDNSGSVDKKPIPTFPTAPGKSRPLEESGWA